MMALVGAGRLVERNWLIYRRSWLVFLSGFAEPLVFLLAIDVGFDPLVGTVTGPGGTELTYPEFVAPGLLASAAMNGSLIDVTYNLYYRITHTRIFDTIAATPLPIGHAILGEVLWSQLRGAAYSIGFLAILVAFGLTSSPWIVLAVPATFLLGFTFAALGAASTSYARNWGDLDYVQLVLLPLYLFSTGFYPLSVYPGWSQPLVQISPLYHGVTLIRSLAVGQVGPALIGHVTYLVALGWLGVFVLRRRLAHLVAR